MKHIKNFRTDEITYYDPETDKRVVRFRVRKVFSLWGHIVNFVKMGELELDPALSYVEGEYLTKEEALNQVNKYFNGLYDNPLKPQGGYY